MAEAARAASIGLLSGLRDRLGALVGQFDHRARLLGEMRTLGGQIDQAYAAYAASPGSEADRCDLAETQAKLQSEIEVLRTETDAILAGLWEFHRSVGEGLVELARHEPAALAVAKRFKRLPAPTGVDPKLHLLRIQELLDQATTSPASQPATVEPERKRQTGGLMTVNEVAALCGVSNKTVYRLAAEGRIPYVKIQSNLRFRRRAVKRWLETKSFEPKQSPKARTAK